MEVLSFEIEGKFAHFRKYFANNTAFTFAIPPRTTIMGIIAGAMGLEKDSYYEEFSSENLKLGVALLSPVKKSFHRLNFLMIKGDSDFRGKQKHIQTPFEVVSGIDHRNDLVKYRIFIAPSFGKENIFIRIKEIFLSGNFFYNPTLGAANFTARISNVKIWEEVEIVNQKDKEVSLNSAGLSQDITEISFDKTDDFRFNMIEEELMPSDFKANNDREVVKMNRVLFTTGGTPLNVRLTGDIYILKNKNEEQIIQFLE
ncbi:MAG: CRISPR-associated protein Cas5 [Spirochaetaceae bacterium]|nr:CRISPR-associated protein Cas5 [Spirochaetaceae bacterium]